MTNSICGNNQQLRNVLEAINAEPAGISFIIDAEKKLVGVVTDGDFRRLLLSGKKLEDPLLETDYNNCVVASQGEDIHALIKKTNKKVRIIPIIDDKGYPIDYFRYEHKTRFTPVAEPSLTSKELEYLTDAFLSTWISSRGKYIDRFEIEFAQYVDCKFGVATSNGTVAIHLALVALGVGKGDEVIVPDLTFAATINAVLHCGATPVIVDVEKERWTISPHEMEAAITENTKAIIPVHIYGQPCEMDEIMRIANKHKLFVVEDCAEAHGAMYSGKKVGSFGHISTYSFFGNKILTTGEGGMCVTTDVDLDGKMRVLRDHGMSPTKKYWHDEIGFNYRMTNLQAAIGCAQLERIDSILSSRFRIEETYRKCLAELNEITWQLDFQEAKRVVWLVSILVKKKNRNEIIRKLKEQNIDARPFFYPLSKMPIYEQYSTKECKNAQMLSSTGINLPTVEDVDLSKIATAFNL
ncbi:MAG: aminotransferase class I/II-fold pyridoxal phosphate-dependent enzyme [Flavobacteriales bacterium]|nr:aminotransferase class I/II-fold pyridoxal phosphate-dependent enzyme [Flavobacteriales bacterium]